MINRSQTNDPRSWKKWEAAGAVGTIYTTEERRITSLFKNEAATETHVGGPLSGLETALVRGARIHGFRSGGGLRVVRVENAGKLVGYGEHPSVDHALLHADEDFLAGGREYQDVYGKKYPAYWTGSSEQTSPLDGWLLQGHTFDAYAHNNCIVAELKGTANQEIPQDVLQRAKEGESVTWESRGFVFETSPFKFPNGEMSGSTRVLKRPALDRTDDFMYGTTRKGIGNTLNEAIENAIKAEPEATRYLF